MQLSEFRASSALKLGLGLLLTACAPRPNARPPTAEPTLLPQPQHLATAGPGYRPTPRTALLLHDTAAAPVARYLREWLAQAGPTLPAPRFATDTTEPGIHFSLTQNPGPDSLREQYQLRVTSRGIWLRARTPDGLFWGVQTLRQLLPAAAEAPTTTARLAPELRVPGVTISDRPAFAWRGLMLDVSRHFLPLPQLRQYVDLLALHKLNRLHLHLTDDQGWRLPSRAWPRLSTVGAFRAGPNGQPYGGFYTAAELRGLVAYAHQRHVELVPEIDLPGHVRAALAAYPELSCTGQALPVATDWGVHEDVLCVGNPQSLQFAADVLSEVMDLFPGRYVHVGGDETPTARWRACPRCQALMRREGLRSAPELQGYFLRQVAAVLAARGRQPLVWDEALGQTIPPPAGTVMQAWHGLGPVAAATRAGYAAVASPSGFAYFDQNTAILDLPKVFQFTPVPAGLSKLEKSWVLGGEATLWTERIEPDQVDQAVFPRLLALAEVLWDGPQPAAAYPKFLARTRRHYPRLAALGVRVGFETRPLVVATTPTAAGLRAALSPGGPDIDLHFTLDGTVPGLTSARYTAPLEIATPTRLRVLASRDGRPLAGLLPVSLGPHAATGAAVALAAPYHPAYPASGPQALTDGVLGSTDYRDGSWQGFEKTDLEATIDLGQPQQLDSVRVAFLQDWNSWIFLPRTVQFSVSVDGQVFFNVTEVKTTELLNPLGPLRRSYGAAPGPEPVRYVRVRARNVGVCPPGHPGAGGGAFLMADEVVVRARR